MTVRTGAATPALSRPLICLYRRQMGPQMPSLGLTHRIYSLQHEIREVLCSILVSRARPRYRGKSIVSKAPDETRPVMVYRPIQPGASSLKQAGLCRSLLLSAFPARREGMERSSVDYSHFRHCLCFCCGGKISVDGLEEGHGVRKGRMCGLFVITRAAVGGR